MTNGDPLCQRLYAEVVRVKTMGNGHFSKGELEKALSCWNAALNLYDGKPGDDAQRREKSKICSNCAQAHLSLDKYSAARSAADHALEYDDANAKARFRRARALLALGGLEELTQAADDIKRIKADGGTLGEAEAALLRTAEGPLLKVMRDKEANQAAVKAEVAAASPDDLAKAAAAAAAVAPMATAAKAEAAAAAAATANTADKSAAAARVAEAEAAEEAEVKRAWAQKRRDQVLEAKRSAWMGALGERRELCRAWLVDVYRTRVDDDCAALRGLSIGEARRAAELEQARAAEDKAAGLRRRRAVHGLGDPRASRLSVLSDFLVFCKLVAARRMVPTLDPSARWDWEAFLEVAATMLDNGFSPERCHAEVRYGPRAGGAALRLQGTLAYEGPAAAACEDARAPGAAAGNSNPPAARHPPAGSPHAEGELDTLMGEVEAAVGAACWGDDARDGAGAVQHRFTFDREPAVFDSVGGIKLWKSLNERLKAGRLGGAGR